MRNWNDQITRSYSEVLAETTAAKFQLVKVRLRKKELELSEQGISEADASSHILVQVQDALRRIQFNAYGFCLACGKQIDWHRLEEIPWTRFCEEDESKYEPVGASLKKRPSLQV